MNVFKFKKPSLIASIVTGEISGLFIGFIVFIFLSYFMIDVSILFRWGILLWYVSLGTIIGVFSIFNFHVISKSSPPWWVRVSILCAWMNFILTLLAYQTIEEIMITTFGEHSVFSSPFWFVFKGVIVGLIIGFLVKKYVKVQEKTIDK